MLVAGATPVADLAVTDLELMSWCLILMRPFCANAILTGRGLWVGLRIFSPFSIRRETSYANPCIGSPGEILLLDQVERVGLGNKFVLLDMTEEPEAKKLTVYNTNEI